MTRTDRLLALVLIFAAGLMFYWLYMTPSSASSLYVQVELSGRPVGNYPLLPLDEGKLVSLDIPGGQAVLSFEKGGVRILPLPRTLCPLGLCSRQGLIDKPGEEIVCAPNRLVVRVVGGGEKVDAIAR